MSMKLFISYSRDDKAWVYELWRALRDRAHHDAWIDQRLLPAQDWWDGIIQNIETCDCFVCVMTPKSTESIYCSAELNYALALNKPVLPLMLKQCDVPEDIRSRRIQYEPVRDDMSLGDTLFAVAQGLTEVRIGLIQGKYPPPAPLPKRPEEPKPERKPEQVSEVFMLAEEAAAGNNISLAKKLYQEVMEADPLRWGLAAAERLEAIQQESSRNQEYLTIAKMTANPTLIKGAKAAWRVYLQKYGLSYDPNNLEAMLTEPPVSAFWPTIQQDQTSKVLVRRATKQPKAFEIIPKPFVWIDIPAGTVTLGGNIGANGGYINSATYYGVSAFSIAKYPLTNSQYEKFIKADGYNQKKWWTNDGWQIREKEGWDYPRYWYDEKWNKPDYPVVGVSWYEAIAYCLWLANASGENITLPTDNQWQWAAQGDRKWAYPYGDRFDETRCNFNTQGTTSVIKYEGKAEDDSPYGVVDMCGNVWEWCLTKYSVGDNRVHGADTRVLRGGSWKINDSDHMRVDYRSRNDPFNRDDSWGFRIARNFK